MEQPTIFACIYSRSRLCFSFYFSAYVLNGIYKKRRKIETERKKRNSRFRFSICRTSKEKKTFEKISSRNRISYVFSSKMKTNCTFSICYTSFRFCCLCLNILFEEKNSRSNITNFFSLGNYGNAN